MRDPRPLKNYDRPDVPTIEELLEDSHRRRFLELTGAGALTLVGGGFWTACSPGNDDDDNDDDSGGGDDDLTPGDDDDTHNWDDDGGIDDDDDSAMYECRLPAKGDHSTLVLAEDSLTYAIMAWVTDPSVTSYLHTHEEQAFEILDGLVVKYDCASLPKSATVVQVEMANALTEFIRDVGGLTCSVAEVEILIVDCVPAPA